MSSVDRIAADPRFRVLDRAAGPLTDAVAKVPRAARDFLHGTWLGHPLHPAVAMLPVGAFLGSAVIDVATTAAAVAGAGTPERRDGADDASALLLGVGLAAVPLAAAAGAADWSQLHPEQKRIGLVHAAANGAATVALLGSLVQRRRGRRGSGRALGVAGTLLSGAAAAIGGHLAYRWGAGTNHVDEVPHVTAGVGEGESAWTTLGPITDFPDGTPVLREVGGTAVVVVRTGDTVHALANECSHLAGPLHEGTVTQEPGSGACITCPWHASTFALSDGHVVHGPATSPQPPFLTRILGDDVQARAVPAGASVDLRDGQAVAVADAAAHERRLGQVM